MNRVILGPEYFPKPDIGRPISGAQIFVGEVDTDPEVVINQKQLSVLQEDNSVIEVDQPVITGAGGIPIHNGSPVTILVDGNYALKVLDSLGVQIYYVPSQSSDTDASLMNYNEGSTGAVDRTVESRLQDFVSIKDFGDVGTGADDSTAFTAAKATGEGIYLPSGTYDVPTGTYNTVDFYTDGAVTILNNTTIVARSMSDKSVRFWSPDASEIFEMSVLNNGLMQLLAVASSFSPDPRFVLDNVDLALSKDSDDTKIEPALFLRKNSTAGASNMGLAKIQWRMTTDLGTEDVDAGRLDAVIIDPTEGDETVRMGLSTQVDGNGESQACMSWQDGVMVPDGVTTIFPFGFGTLNLADALFNRNLKVLGERITGWTTPTGSEKRDAWSTPTITLEELAEVVKAMIVDNKTHGFIGN